MIPGSCKQKGINFPLEEIKDRRILLGFFVGFLLLWLFLITMMAFSPGGYLCNHIGIIILVSVFYTWISAIAIFFKWGSGKKILKILNRHNIYDER
jgi:hypothetical protein